MSPTRLAGRSRRSERSATRSRHASRTSSRTGFLRSAPTARRTSFGLQRLLPDLVKEFDGVRSDGEIRACADAILADYDEAPVRSFVMTLAHRRTRECLAAEHCDALVSA